jgi:hypothetical protein
MSGNTTYLSITTILNGSGLIFAIKRHRMWVGVKKTKPNCLLTTRNTSHWQRQTLTSGKRMEQDFPSKQTSKVGSSTFAISNKRFQTKISSKRKISSFYIKKGCTPSREDNNY